MGPSAVVGAGMAGATVLRACCAGRKIAAPLFVLPVAFVYIPELITMAPGATTLLLVGLVMLGAIAIIYGLNYPFRLSVGRLLLVRAALTVLGVLVMTYPMMAVKLGGVAVFITVFVAEKVMARGLQLPFARGVEQ